MLPLSKISYPNLWGFIYRLKSLFYSLCIYAHARTRTHTYMYLYPFVTITLSWSLCPLLSSEIREVCIFPFCSRLFWQFWVLCINFKKLFIYFDGTGLHGFERGWGLFLWSTGARARGLPKLGVAVPRPQSTGSVGVVLGWLGLRRAGSSRIRDGTRVSCISWQILYNWATREAPPLR